MASSFENAIVETILDEEPITSVIGTRIHPLVLPEVRQGVQRVPAIVYELGDIEHEYCLNGPLGLATASVSFGCFSTTEQGASELAKVLKDLLNGYKGHLDVEHNFVACNSTIEGETIYQRDPAEGSDDWGYVYEVQFQILYKY